MPLSTTSNLVYRAWTIKDGIWPSRILCSPCFLNWVPWTIFSSNHLSESRWEVELPLVFFVHEIIPATSSLWHFIEQLFPPLLQKSLCCFRRPVSFRSLVAISCFFCFKSEDNPPLGMVGNFENLFAARGDSLHCSFAFVVSLWVSCQLLAVALCIPTIISSQREPTRTTRKRNKGIQRQAKISSWFQQNGTEYSGKS